ncbi:MAG: bifunctional metallophosphatase/5'-nucleotidase [Bacteroidia bacterium]
MKELQNRKDFIKKTIYLVGFGALANSPLKILAKGLPKKIVVLHTNDWHSRIEPFPASDKNFANKGGAAFRAKIIQQIRKNEPNVLLLDAGDIFQGTPYFNFFGGELEFKLMSEMQYDCATLGNHDFDNGIEGFYKMLKYANFSFVNANYDFKNTLLENKIQPYKIFNKQGIKVGIFGVGIELKDLVPDKLYGNIIYNNPIDAANKTALTLKQKGCDLIICLSHLGNKYNNNKVSDETLATQTNNIDLIIGGHTHTFLPEPIAYKNLSGKTTLVNQVGWAGINLGVIEFEFSPLNKKIINKVSSIKSIENSIEC